MFQDSGAKRIFEAYLLANGYAGKSHFPKCSRTLWLIERDCHPVEVFYAIGLIMFDGRDVLQSAARAFDVAISEMRFRTTSIVVGTLLVAGAAGLARKAGVWDAVHDAIAVPLGASPRVHKPTAAPEVFVAEPDSLKDFSFPRQVGDEPMKDFHQRDANR